MGERFLPFLRTREVPDEVRSSRLVDRITGIFLRGLANQPRRFKDSPSWEEISFRDLEILEEKERKYLLKNSESGIQPWIYAHTRENEAYIAIGLGGKRVKYFVNGGKSLLIRGTRERIGVWEEEKKGREISWEQIERMVDFAEGVPQRRLLGGAGSSQVDRLPGPVV